MIKYDIKNGFSLSEVLIALLLVGTVATFAIPSILQSSRRIVLTNSAKKQMSSLSQGMTMLAIKSSRLNYQTTQGFVDDFQEFFRVSKVCDSSKIAECWPTEKITLADGSEYSIGNATTKTVFLMNNVDPDGNEANYANDNVAMITANGTSVLINYNKDCNPNIGDSNRNCYVALVDLNGEKSPNKVGEDLLLVNAKNFVVVDPNDVESSGTAGARSFTR